MIENAPSFGIVAGWGKYLRDVAISGNVIRNAFVGIGVSVTPGAGTALVSNNVIPRLRAAQWLASITRAPSRRISPPKARPALRRWSWGRTQYGSSLRIAAGSALQRISEKWITRRNRCQIQHCRPGICFGRFGGQRFARPRCDHRQKPKSDAAGQRQFRASAVDEQDCAETRSAAAPFGCGRARTGRSRDCRARPRVTGDRARFQPRSWPPGYFREMPARCESGASARYRIIR